MPEPAKDYLAAVTEEPQDAKHYGVRGMRWGVSRSTAALKVAAAKRGESETPSTSTSSSDGSAARYEQLKVKAKAEGPSSLSDTDLKFFNARTEAMAKVARITEARPNWLSSTLKDVAQSTFKQQLSAVAAGVATKYLNDKMNPAPTLEQAIAKGVSDLRRKDAIDAGVTKAIETSDYVGRHKKALAGTSGYRGKRSK